MHRPLAALAVFAAAALLAPAALADQPTRQPLPSAPFTVSGSCTFDVLVETIANKEFATTFTSGKQIITGRLVARLTNVSTGKSVVVQISGPGIEDLSNPSVFNLNGTSLLFPPGQLLLTRGPVSLTFDQNGNVTSLTMTSASSVDLCPVLGDP